MVLEPGKSAVRMLGESVSGEDPLSSSRMVYSLSLLGPQLAEGPRELPGVFFKIRALIPFMTANTPQRLHLKTPLPCRAGFNTRTWGQDIGLSL